MYTRPLPIGPNQPSPNETGPNETGPNETRPNQTGQKEKLGHVHICQFLALRSRPAQAGQVIFFSFFVYVFKRCRGALPFPHGCP